MKRIIILIISLILTLPIVVNAKSSIFFDTIKEIAETTDYAGRYTGEHQDSFGEEPTNTTLYYYYGNRTEDLDRSNVLFGNFCWRILRTTGTGGIKLLYNGVPTENKCSGDISRDIGNSSFNRNDSSLAYIGYMYNQDAIYTYKNELITQSDIIFGNSIEYNNGNYTLVDASPGFSTTKHYTCNNTSGICEIVRYYVDYNYYIELSEGKTVQNALADMLNGDNVNKTDSSIKKYIDTWYENNLTAYTKYLEDVIYCNDRRVKQLGGWDPDGPSIAGISFRNASDMLCPNITDQFSLSNPKAQLKYPVGLATYRELYIINKTLRSSSNSYWTLTPIEMRNKYPYGKMIRADGVMSSYYLILSTGVKPVVSLKPNIRYLSGNGSMDNPYTIDYSDYYKVIVEEDEKQGEVEFETEDINNLKEGEPVVFKLIPAKGYEVKSVKIIDKDNNNINYNTTDNINYRFIMPATDVTINPQFQKIDTNSNSLPNPNTKRQILLIVISIIIVGIFTIMYIKKKKNN